MRKQYDYSQSFTDFELLSTVPVVGKCEKHSLKENVYEYTLVLKWDVETAKRDSSELCVRFMLPGTDLQYMWHPDTRVRRVLDADWRLNISSMLTCSAPMAMLFNGEGMNTFTFASN